MAQPGNDAFTPETHAELLRLSQVLSKVELAAKFGVSVPTIYKWMRLTVGYRGGKPGRVKKAEATDIDPGCASSTETVLATSSGNRVPATRGESAQPLTQR